MTSAVVKRIGWMAGILAVAMLGARGAHATITSVSASPDSTTVPLGRTASLTVSWTVSTSTGPSVSSNQAVFCLPGGQVLDTVPTSLSRSVAANQTVTFTESVTVGADLIQRAHQAGAMRIEYARSFEDSDGLQGAGTGVVDIAISGAAGAGFEINRLSLRFEDGSALRVVEGNGSVRVSADVNYLGAGQLEAQWEVATPPSTDGSPVFRTLRTVRRYLGAGGREVLAGPQLPTERAGLYLVRLTVTDPETGFDAPLVRYYVSATRAAAAPEPMAVRSPGERAVLSGDTTFAWDPVDGASAYKLELYPMTAPGSGAEQPVAGMLVPAVDTSVNLTALARSHLEPGSAYRWRVRAIGDDGRLVGESPLRALRVPGDAARPQVQETRPDGGE